MAQDHRYLLRLPEALFAKLSREALAQNVSVNTWVVNKLQDSAIGSSDTLVIHGESLPLKQLQEAFNNAIEAIVLFGSRATNTAHQGSDVDLLLVMNESCIIERDLYTLWDKVVSPRSLLSPQFCHLPKDVHQASSLWFEMALDGIVLKDRELKTNQFLGELRSYLIKEKFERKTAHGQGYWVLKQGV